MDLNTAYENALMLAIKGHEGQYDKGGMPYINHPMAVSTYCDTKEAKIVALLHDTLEDTDITYEEICEGCGKEIADLVQMMTHDDSVPYMDYVKFVGQNPVTREVKLADLRHNTQPGRIIDMTEKDHERMRKYRTAIEYLKGL